MSDFKKAKGYLESDNEELNSLFAKIKALEELNKKVASHLEPHLANHCIVANVVGNKLVLIAANGSIATQMRFQSVDLLQKLHQDARLKYIKTIECKVRLHSSNRFKAREVKFPNMLPISHETSEIIRAMADSIEDKSLREVMKRISTRIKKS